MRKRYFNNKDDVNLEDLYYMSPFLISMLVWTNAWCFSRGINPYWTSMHRKPMDGISKSNTHQTYRAMDISLIAAFGWTTGLIDEFRADFYQRFKKIGALVWSSEKMDYISVPIYIHGKGKALHAHLQIRKILKIEEDLL